MSKTFKDKVTDEYFTWLYNWVCKGRAHENVSYKKIFTLLHQIEFTFTIPNDINRAKDGAYLRYRFAIDSEDDSRFQEDIMDALDGPCSVLEMMIALAIRCEESIMDDTRYGDRTGQWFWEMMTNVGISHMIDERFDRIYAEQAIYDFLDRRYTSDGKGGLFYIRGCTDDLRKVEIWTQLCWYLYNYE